MPDRFVTALRAAPIAVPCGLAVVLLTWWEADGAGFSVTLWAPGLLLVLGLLAVGALTVANPWGDVPRPVVLAAGLLTAFTLWSYASIAWAGDPGAALEDANRTLLYLLLFSLFALWRLGTAAAHVLVAAWTLGLVAIAVVTTVRLQGAADPTGLFSGDRLATPVGYPNAAAATFAMGLWSALVLAASDRVHPTVRGLCGGGAVLFVDLALLAQSRGAFLAIPLTGLACLILVPGRLRLLVALLGFTVGVAVSAPSVLDASSALTPTGQGPGGADAINSAARMMLLGAALVGLVTVIVALLERTLPPAESTRVKLARGGRVVAGLGAVAALVVVLAVAGNPVNRLDNAWESFKGGYGQGDGPNASRLTSGLGSNRYDFFRVAVNGFKDAPLIGQGAGAFRQAYLAQGSSEETPRYPHSVELKVLSQTGIVGALLLLGALGAAAGPPGAGCALGGRRRGAPVPPPAAPRSWWPPYVFAHGSADWFWETAGLTGPAFALLGLAAGLCPRTDPSHGLRSPRTRTRVEVAVRVWAPCSAAGGGGRAHPGSRSASGIAPPTVFASRPLEAYSRLDRAATLNPFSDDPALLEGTIALRYGDLPRAERAFSETRSRGCPDGQYATLQRGAIASALGQRSDAERLLRMRPVRSRLATPLRGRRSRSSQDGGTIDLTNLSRRILGQAQTIGE